MLKGTVSTAQISFLFCGFFQKEKIIAVPHLNHDDLIFRECTDTYDFLASIHEQYRKARSVRILAVINPNGRLITINSAEASQLADSVNDMMPRL